MKALPRYHQIINYYQKLIEDGTLKEGTQMATEQEICKQFGVSRNTVRQALDELVQLGYIYKVQGKGTFISFSKTAMQMNHLLGFSEEMRAQGKEPATVLLENKIEMPSEAGAKALQIEQNQPVYLLIRLRCADGVPMAVEKVHIPCHRFVGLDAHNGNQSLYQLLKEDYGCECSRASQNIQAGIAASCEAKLLKVPTGTPILHITRTTYDSDGIPFEYVDSVYRGDKYVFSVTIEK